MGQNRRPPIPLLSSPLKGEGRNSGRFELIRFPIAFYLLIASRLLPARDGYLALNPDSNAAIFL
jgi:hypothetical protein